MNEAPDLRAYGGKTVYGAAVGVLMLETRFPRIPGDIGHGGTWPFPVLYAVVPGATGERVTTAKQGDRSTGLLDAFIEAGRKLVRDGADGITTSCGFLSIYQKELATEIAVPVAASSLMQIPLVERLLPQGKRAGVLTFQAERLTPTHLCAAGARADTPVIGMEHRREFWRYMAESRDELDVMAARQDILDGGQELAQEHPDVGAVVLECTNMVPFARALHAQLKMPVYSIRSFITWFQSGLDPRGFGLPGDPL
ncbi:MAG TPA: aspartate/glutamate racemase family protein [Candidatus Limnocylindria bacterium]